MMDKRKCYFQDGGVELVKALIVIGIVYLFIFLGPKGEGFGFVYYSVVISIILYWGVFTPHFNSLKVFSDGIFVAELRFFAFRRKLIKWDQVTNISISLPKSDNEIFSDRAITCFVRVQDISGKKYRNILWDKKKFIDSISNIYIEGKLVNLKNKPAWLTKAINNRPS